MTGVELPSVRMASHGKPWRSAANAERLDPDNGPLLLPQYDKLFDRAYVTVDGGGALPVAPALPKDRLDPLGFREDGHLTRAQPNHHPVFAYHRDRKFIHREDEM